MESSISTNGKIVCETVFKLWVYPLAITECYLVDCRSGCDREGDIDCVLYMDGPGASQCRSGCDQEVAIDTGGVI